MNPQGLMIEHMEKGEEVTNQMSQKLSEEFSKRLHYFMESYKKTDFYEHCVPSDLPPIKKDKTANTVSWSKQFGLIFKREITTIIRNPFDLKVKILQYIFFCLIIMSIYNEVLNFFLVVITNKVR